MNILVLNGSPKGEKSNTFKLTAAFLNGLNAGRENQVQTVTMAKERIEPCLGCYACWTKTPGKCVIDDDMAGHLQHYIEADLVIWSFPLYYFSMPSKIKGFMDRLLPTVLPELTEVVNGRGGHPTRYDFSRQRHVLISTCGFHSVQGNYDALFQQFDRVFGDSLSKIICPEGELLRVPYLSERTDEYLSYVKKAGEEFSSQGGFSPKTQSRLDERLYPTEAFMEMANAEWEVADASVPTQENQLSDQSYKFVRQMAATYNPAGYTKDIVLEMDFTDIGKTYQLLLGKEKCVVETDDFTPYTTRIETTFDVWLNISEGKISGSEAMMKHQYRVLGDFDTMLKMDELFGASKPEKPAFTPASGSLKSSNMLLALFPFLALWILLPMNSQMGAVAGIIAAGIVTILHFWWKPTPYERVGAFLVTLIGLYVIVTGGTAWQIALPSFAFGVMWTVSSFLKIPLTSYYSCKGYGGEAAYENLLFIKTNRILTAMWGGAYLLLGVAALFVAGTAIAPFWGLLSNLPTLLLGLFTAWFPKWYPAHVAKG